MLKHPGNMFGNAGRDHAKFVSLQSNYATRKARLFFPFFFWTTNLLQFLCFDSSVSFDSSIPGTTSFFFLVFLVGVRQSLT
jgi:hypothetical protein